MNRLSRRKILNLMGLAVLALSSKYARAAASPAAIIQPEQKTPRGFIDRAFTMRRQASECGDQPYGVVIVKDGLIVGQSQSRVVIDRDPTAHAEMEAIRDAARRLGTRDLSGRRMYSSSKPCPMCEAASYWAGLDKLFHGSEITAGGAPDLCG